MVVESKEICQLLTKIDENGLYHPYEEIGFSKASYKNGYQPYNNENKEEAAKLNSEEKAQSIEKSSKVQEVVNEEGVLDNHIPDGDD